MAVRVAHYLNQFFAGYGGEEAGDREPGVEPGPRGAGRLLARWLGGEGIVVATAVCGDNRFAEEPERSAAAILAGLRAFAPDVLLAGPGFASGRYGYACARLCQSAADDGLPAATALHADNPAVPLFGRTVAILPCAPAATGMEEALRALAALALTVDADGALRAPEGQTPLGWRARRNVLQDTSAGERAVELLLARLRGQPVGSEIPLPEHEAPEPAPPLRAASGVRLALVTDGGLVAKGNPERMPSGRSTRFCRLPVAGLERLSPDGCDVVHHGYDTRCVAEDPNRLVPLDAARRLVREGRVGSLHEVVYATAGVGTGAQAAAAMGRDLATELLAGGVQAAILTST